MKYKIPILLLLSFCSTIFSQISQINLFGVGPAHQIIKNGTTIITEPGSYHVIENITGDITVNADNVLINLKGFTVSGNAAKTSVFNVGEGQKNIVIQNGSIFGSDQVNTGVLIDDSAQNIVIQDLNVANCSTGIAFSGAIDKYVRCCKVTNCFVADSSFGFSIDFAMNCVFENCESCCCTEGGFVFTKSKYNKIKKCKAIRTGSSFADKQAVGFSAISGQDNLFFECMAEGIYKSASEFGKDAIGFRFASTGEDAGETESKIINCLVDSLTGAELGNAYGIILESVFKSTLIADPASGCPAILSNFEDSIADISWSPLGDKIAIVFSGEASEGISAGPVKILDFNCKTWHEVSSLTTTSNDKRHIEWDPTGRYLAIGALSGQDDEVVVYDTLYGLIMGDNPDVDVSDPVWFRSGKYVVYIRGGAFIDVYKVDGTLTNVANSGAGIDTGLTDLTNPDITPDEKFIAFGSYATGDLFVRDWKTHIPFSTVQVASDTSTGLTGINDVQWCPIACNGKYYLVAVGTGATANINVYSFDGIDLVFGGAALFDDTVLRIKWAPNGNYFAVFATNGTVGVYKFDPSVSPVISLVYSKSLGIQVSQGGLDWSPSGNFLVFGGDDGSIIPNFNIIEVGIAPTKCVVYNNKVANVTGGLGGIGIFGSSDCNSILKNICYECDLSFSQKVLNVWYCGLVGIDQLHYNVSIPPY
ncbi:WD40 repeat domain-containing protein [Candidatus Dependentiae bacterium]